jgi:hypothetical protein
VCEALVTVGWRAGSWTSSRLMSSAPSLEETGRDARLACGWGMKGQWQITGVLKPLATRQAFRDNAVTATALYTESRLSTYLTVSDPYIPFS